MNKDAEIEQYFTLWEDPFPFEAEYDHWVRRGKLLRVWLDLPGICDVTMNVEVVGDLPRGNKKGASLDLELRFLFSPGNDPELVESPTVLVRGTVLSAEPAEMDGDKIYKIGLRVGGCVFRVLASDGFGEPGIHEGNILRGFFYVLGKIKRRENQ